MASKSHCGYELIMLLMRFVYSAIWELKMSRFYSQLRNRIIIIFYELIYFVNVFWNVFIILPDFFWSFPQNRFLNFFWNLDFFDKTFIFLWNFDFFCGILIFLWNLDFFFGILISFEILIFIWNSGLSLKFWLFQMEFWFFFFKQFIFL